MKRYYCSNCKSEITSVRDNIPTNMCPICRHCTLVKVVEWETPEQYKERTGNEWKGAKYYLVKGSKKTYWTTEMTWGNADHIIAKVCACTSWGKPPDDWRPK